MSEAVETVITQERLAAIMDEAFTKVPIIKGTFIQTLENFFYNSHYDLRKGTELLKKTAIINSDETPSVEYVQRGLFERAFVKYDNVLPDREVLRYESFLTQRGEVFLDLLLNELKCPLELPY